VRLILIVTGGGGGQQLFVMRRKCVQGSVTGSSMWSILHDRAAISVVSSALIFISICSDELSSALMIPFRITLTCTVNNKCATRNNPSTGCGTSCQGDFQCSSGVCNRCVNGSSAQPQCGLYCYDNTGCSIGANGCTSCLSNGNGICVCSASSQCGFLQ
jgi:hypothetical protein